MTVAVYERASQSSLMALSAGGQARTRSASGPGTNRSWAVNRLDIRIEDSSGARGWALASDVRSLVTAPRQAS